MIFLAKALRIAVFLMLVFVFGMTGFLWGNGGHSESPIGAIVGVLLAWPVSGIPLYWRRHKARSTSMEIALR
jgi:membrane protein YdbS with pleckstrin-like domain